LTLTAAVPANPPPTEIEVAGRVLDAFSWAIEGVTVFVTGQGPVVTDSRGRFEFEHVRIPYDLTVIGRDWQDRPLVLVHAGLSRTDPTVTVMPRTFYAASIRGRVSGASPEQTSGTVAFSSGAALATSVPIASDGSFDFSGTDSATWAHGERIIGTLHALQWQASDTGPTAYSYGKKENVSLTTGASLTSEDFQVGSVGLTELHGTIDGAAFVKEVTLYISFDPDSFVRVQVDTSGTHEFRYKMPDVPGASCLVTVRAQTAGGWTTSRQVGDCSAELVFLANGAAPRLTTPDEGVVLDSGSELGWRGWNNVYQADLVPEDPALPRYLLRTEKQRIKVQDLNSAGIVLPRSARYRWKVTSDFSWGSIDDLASYAGALYAEEEVTKKAMFEIPCIEYGQVESSIRRFTTAP